MASQVALKVSTPAKVNLGLEVIGRRTDGFHNVVTVLQAISIFDHFTWHNSDQPLHYQGIEGIEAGSDIVREVFRNAICPGAFRGLIQIDKQIPVSAGLGGGSSDAAMALRLAESFRCRTSLESRAMNFGSDVPFFIGGGTSLATGTGTSLDPLPVPELWFVIVVPKLEIRKKTISMYHGLERSDFSNGDRVFEFADRLRIHEKVTTMPPNAFSRQLLGFEPVAIAWAGLEQAGATCISVSGAGPSIFAVFDQRSEAQLIFDRLIASPGKKFLARSLTDHFADAVVGKIGNSMRGLPTRD